MQLHIIYASTSGNVELVCEHVASYLSDHFQIESILHRAEKTDINVLLDNTKFILATSTWEHGELNPYFVNLHQQMSRQSMKDKSAGFIGLGDKRYEPVLFCEGMEIVRKTFLERGGQEVGEALKINGEPHHQLNLVDQWCEQFGGLITA